MRIVPLAAVPNQSFTATLDNTRWVVRLVETEGVMAADVDRDGVRLLSGSRVLAGETLIPYRYLETGNFIFLTTGDDLPAWREFGVSQTLVYLSAAEMAEIRANPLTIGEVAPTVVSYLTSDEGFYLTTDDGALLEDV